MKKLLIILFLFVIGITVRAQSTYPITADTVRIKTPPVRAGNNVFFELWGDLYLRSVQYGNTANSLLVYDTVLRQVRRLTLNPVNWDSAWQQAIVSSSFSSGTYSLTRRNGSVMSHSFDSRYPTITRFSDTAGILRALANSMQPALGYTPVPNTRTVNSHPLSSDVTVTKSDVGLGSVDNTTDAGKPISTATQTALDLKVDKTTTVNGHPLSSNVTVSKSDVGLGNTDNTSDANKPISTATQTALDLKAPLTSSVTINTAGNLTGGGNVTLGGTLTITGGSSGAGITLTGTPNQIALTFPNGNTTASIPSALIVSASISSTLLYGAISTASQPNITSVGTLTSVAVSGALTAATLAGTIVTNTQPNITSLGTLSTLNVSGKITTGSLSVTGNATVSGNANVTGSLNTTGDITTNNIAGTSSTMSASVNAGSLTVVGNAVISGNITSNNASLSTVNVVNLVASNNITSANDITALGVVTADRLRGTVITAAQPTITSVGTLTGLTVTAPIGGKATGNYYHLTGSPDSTSIIFHRPDGTSDTIQVYAGGVAAGSVTNLTGTNANGITWTITNPTTTPDISASLGAITPTSVSASGALTGATLAGTIVTTSQPNITGLGTLTALTVSGNIGANTLAGTIITAAQTNITSLGNLTGFTVAGNVVFSPTGSTADTTTYKPMVMSAGGQVKRATVWAGSGGGGGVTVTGNNGISVSGSPGSSITLGLGAITPISISASGNISASYYLIGTDTLYKYSPFTVNDNGAAGIATQSCYYVKFGKQITVYINFTVGNTSGNGDPVTIYGLPYTIKNTGFNVAGSAVAPASDVNMSALGNYNSKTVDVIVNGAYPTWESLVFQAVSITLTYLID